MLDRNGVFKDVCKEIGNVGGSSGGGGTLAPPASCSSVRSEGLSSDNVGGNDGGCSGGGGVAMHAFHSNCNVVGAGGSAGALRTEAGKDGASSGIIGGALFGVPWHIALLGVISSSPSSVWLWDLSAFLDVPRAALTRRHISRGYTRDCTSSDTTPCPAMDA